MQKTTCVTFAGTATASEEYASSWSADKAIDDNLGTYWSSDDNPTDATFTLDLGGSHNVNRIVVSSGVYPFSFALKVSAGGTSYETVGNYATLDDETLTITFDAQTTRYVVLEDITVGSGDTWAGIYELEVYAAQ